jgi:drug/metabolite transporter (DMT)-like permease
MGQHLVTAALILASMTFTVFANLSLKVGAQRQDDVVSGPFSILNTHVAIGAASFALAFLFYALVQRRLPLSFAQALFSVQFVLVILAANLVLHESIGGVRWMGIALMAVGLLVVSLSPDSKPAAAVPERQIAEQR